MARTQEPGETPDDSSATPGNSESSIMARMEQGAFSSRYLGRISKLTSPSPPVAGEAAPEPQAMTTPQLPPPAGEWAPRDGEQITSSMPPTSLSTRLRPPGMPALPSSGGSTTPPATEAWTTSRLDDTFREPVTGNQQANTPPPQGSTVLLRRNMPPWSGETPQQAGDGLQAQPPSSGKVTLPRPVSLTQIAVPARFIGEAATPSDAEEYNPAPSQTLTASGRTQTPTAPSLPPPEHRALAPGFMGSPEEPVSEAPLRIPWADDEATPMSAPEETIELPKETGPLEAPPIIATATGAATTFLPNAAEEAPLAAAVTKLQGACRELVDRVYKMRAMKSNAQIIGALVELVNDLDVRYATDTSTTRRDGMEDLLVEIRRSVAEGDRFILESLENGRGGLSVASFERDLKTIAKSDQPRMFIAYATFLVVILTRGLHRYLQPLAKDEWRMRDVMTRLDYLLDGVRQVLVARLSSSQSGK